MNLGLTLVTGGLVLTSGAGGGGIDEEGQRKAEKDGWAKTEHCGGFVWRLSVCGSVE